MRIRACHVHGQFVTKANRRPSFTLREALENPRRDVNRIVLPPASMLQDKQKLEQRWPAAVEFIRSRKLNEFFGPVVTLGGQHFEQTRVYQENRERIHALVKLERLNPDTFGRNLAEMLKRQLTFAEADQSTEFRIVARQRLRQVWRPIKEQLAQVA